jgi:hypothetical protein
LPSGSTPARTRSIPSSARRPAGRGGGIAGDHRHRQAHRRSAATAAGGPGFHRVGHRQARGQSPVHRHEQHGVRPCARKAVARRPASGVDALRHISRALPTSTRALDHARHALAPAPPARRGSARRGGGADRAGDGVFGPPRPRRPGRRAAAAGVRRGAGSDIGQGRAAFGQRAGLVEGHDCARQALQGLAARNSTPSSAARPVPTMIDMGVASPMAQGQAMISTATPATSACVSAGRLPSSQPDRRSARPRQTTGTNTASPGRPAPAWAAWRPALPRPSRRSGPAGIGPHPRRAVTPQRAGAVHGARRHRIAGRLGHGQGSPVSMDSSIQLSPEITVPSAASRSPGRSTSTSPGCKAWALRSTTPPGFPPAPYRVAARPAADRRAGAAPGARFQPAAQQDQRHDHRRRLEIHRAGTGGQQAGRQQRHHGIAPGRQRAHRHQRIHVGRRAQRGQAAGQEHPPRPGQNGRVSTACTVQLGPCRSCAAPSGERPGSDARPFPARTPAASAPPPRSGGGARRPPPRPAGRRLHPGPGPRHSLRRPSAATMRGHRIGWRDMAHRHRHVGQVGRRAFDTRQAGQHPLDPRHATGAGHPVQIQHQGFGLRGVSGILQRLHQQGGGAVPVTCAVSEARFTVAPLTPGWALSTRSTRATQDAQVMPSTWIVRGGEIGAFIGAPSGPRGKQAGTGTKPGHKPSRDRKVKG